MLKKDNLLFGVIMGLIAPMLALIIYFFVSFYPKGASFSEFIYFLRTNSILLTSVSTLSLFANAVIFTIYINSHRDKTAKGIFVSTLVYGIFVLLVKFFH